MAATREGEIFSAVSPSEVIEQSHMMVLRRLSDDMTSVLKDVREVRDKVINIEAQNMMGKVGALEVDMKGAVARINDLESERDKRTGVQDFVGWLMKNTPWLIALGAAASAFLLKGHV